MKQCLIIIELVCGLVLVLALSRLTFVKKSIYYGWIDKNKKITLFDYVGQYDGAWIFKSIDYNELLSANPNDSLLKEYINEVRILKIISIIPVSITGMIVLGNICIL
ncbi:hypothetical protein [Chitinophaga filiformis]|uniref:Uncharacterized protein n=1 Tax=Chitinophaga filiformis TaxID=104663 RepID=A0A1G7N8X2_CHIFI|nr:hypothetical protein [Chitinophaga filiformis]SDF70391.1 hypothetical protein SAMN04488121_102707 [Chitinophaga filiformis]